MKVRRKGHFLFRKQQALVALSVLVVVALIFTYRGWAAHNRIMYLDEIFVGEALQPRLVSFRGFTTTFGETVFLQPFSGYLHSVVRASIELILLGPLSHYSAWTFILATSTWTLCAMLLFRTIREIAGLTGGVLAALSLALLHASNIIVLGQLNALQWPMLVVCIVAISTDFRPRTRLGFVLYSAFLILTALNAALAFIPILLLGWRVIAFHWRKRHQDLVFFSLMATPYLLQIFTYLGQRVRVVDPRNPWWFMWREIGYIPKLLLPAELRGSVVDPLAKGSFVLLGLIIGFLLLTITAGMLASFRGQPRVARTIAELVLVSLSTAILSVYLNGNLNHHYVLIPTITAWMAVIIAVHVLYQHHRFRPLGRVSTLAAIGIFVFSSAGLWKNDFRDPFFGPTSGTHLDSAITSSRSWCVNKDDDRVIALTGHSISLPCYVVRQLR